MIPLPLEQLIKTLSKLPGFGPRSAQRAALHMLTNPEAMIKLQKHMECVAAEVKTCSTCGNIGLSDPCHICIDTKRDSSILCVVEGVDDLWAIERSGSFKGVYHVLGGVVSAIEGISPEDINMQSLINRVQQSDNVQEVILALGASIDGQTTSHLIVQRLKNLNVTVSTLAKGIPVGAEVDYMDDGTLALALQGRMQF